MFNVACERHKAAPKCAKGALNSEGNGGNCSNPLPTHMAADHPLDRPQRAAAPSSWPTEEHEVNRAEMSRIFHLSRISSVFLLNLEYALPSSPAILCKPAQQPISEKLTRSLKIRHALWLSRSSIGSRSRRDRSAPLDNLLRSVELCP